MARPTPPTYLPEEDYEAIEAAVMETARGRWFLAEYARRNRAADTRMLLGAIDKLERVIRERNDIGDSGGRHPPREAAEIAAVIAEARRESAAVGPVSAEATAKILTAAAQIQQIAWALRERGLDRTACDALHARAAAIRAACASQDLAGQHVAKLVRTLDDIESRLVGLGGGCGLEQADSASPEPPATPSRPAVEVVPEQPEPTGAVDAAASTEPSGPGPADAVSADRSASAKDHMESPVAALRARLDALSPDEAMILFS